MAKKKEKQNLKTGPIVHKQSSKKPLPDKGGAFINRFSHSTIIIAISLITLLCFKDSLFNQFTNWDDTGYVLKNGLIKSLSLSGLKNILTTPVMGHYHPITMLSYAIEYHFVQLSPGLYHFDSVFFHLLVVILVYWLAYLLTNNKTAALITAILFGIHPMHVESVAWMAGRKDLLCALFYFGACISYLFFIRAGDLKKKRTRYAGTLALYLCALLCKPVAVFLPVTLLLIDYYEKRSWKTVVLVEKIPFFILALAFGIVAIKLNLNHAAEVIDIHKVSYTFIERINLMSYALFIYLWKALVPLNSHNFYTYPAKIHGSLPWYFFLYPVILAALAFAFWHYLRKKREIVFGALFFMANIILLIKFLPVGNAILAERYTYIPYFGLFFILAVGLNNLWVQKSGKYQALKTPSKIILILFMLWCGYLTTEGCMVWHDSITLWTNEILRDRNDAEAYNNRGNEYTSLKQYDAAIKDFDTAIAVNPYYKQAYFDRGICNYNQNKYDEAIKDYHSAIRIDSGYVDAYNNLGTVYAGLKQYDSVIKYYTLTVHIDSNNDEAYNNRGLAYFNSGQYDKAIKDYTSSIRARADNPAAYDNRGTAYFNLKQYDNAIKDFTSSIHLKRDDAVAFLSRGNCYYFLAKYNEAISDYTAAISLNPDYALAHTNRYFAYYNLKKYQLALDDAIRAKQLGANIDPSIFQILQDDIKNETR